jgi:hypothetical protein
MRATDIVHDRISKPNTPITPKTNWSDKHTINNYDLSTPENIHKAVEQNGYNIKYIKNPSEDLQIIAVSNFADALKYIVRPTKKAQIVAINNNPFVIFHMDKDNMLNRVSTYAINACKKHIIEWFIECMKDSDWQKIRLMLNILNKREIQWSELGVIKNRLNTS